MSAVARDGDTTACGASLISSASRTTVNGRLVIRLGDAGSHGGAVSTASTKTFAEGPGVARIGDIYDCPIHGPNPIVTGSGDTFSG